MGSWLGIAALYAAACGIMLWPLCNFSHLGTAHFEGDTRLIIWTLAWDNHAVLDRAPSLFDANIFYPARNALAYSEHLFGISLFTLPIYALTRNPVLSYNVVWILSFVCSAAAAHALAWRYVRNHLAALMAGLIYAFCFYRMHQGHGHLHMIWGFWIPLSLMALRAWYEAPTWGRLWIYVLIVVLQATASWYQAVMTVIANLLLLVWLVFIEPPIALSMAGPRTRIWRYLPQAAAGGLVALALLWPFARHYRGFAPEPPAAVRAGSADAVAYLVPPENTFAGQWMLAHGIRGPRPIWGEVTTFLGWLTLIFAGAGAFVAVRGRELAMRPLRFFVVLGGVAILLAAGPSTGEIAENAWGASPFGLLMHVPGVNLFRVPARFTELLTLALAVMAAGAVATLLARRPRTGRLLTIAAIPLVLSESYVVNFPGGRPAPFPIPRIYEFIATLPPGAVVSLPDFADTPLWFEEADYQYFSTAHWHPIANGYSRTAPPGFRHLIDELRKFPAPSSATAMRSAGIRYVVIHPTRVPGGGSNLRADARTSPDFRLLAQFESDQLFEVLPPARSED